MTTGIAIDQRPYLNRIVEIGPEAPDGSRLVCVEPGVTLAALDRVIGPLGMSLPLEVAHPELATIGGLFGCNAAGYRSRSRGRFAHQLFGVDWVFADGESEFFGRFGTGGEMRPTGRHAPSLIPWLFEETRTKQEGLSKAWPACAAVLGRISGSTPALCVDVLLSQSRQAGGFWEPDGRGLSPLPYSEDGWPNLAAFLCGGQGRYGWAERLWLRLDRHDPRPMLGILELGSVEELLDRMSQIWQESRVDVLALGGELARMVRRRLSLATSADPLILALLDQASERIAFLPFVYLDDQHVLDTFRHLRTELSEEGSLRFGPCIRMGHAVSVPIEQLSLFLRRGCGRSADNQQPAFSLHTEIDSIRFQPWIDAASRLTDRTSADAVESLGLDTRVIPINDPELGEPLFSFLESVRQRLDPHGLFQDIEVQDIETQSPSSMRPEAQATTQWSWVSPALDANCPSFRATGRIEDGVRARMLALERWQTAKRSGDTGETQLAALSESMRLCTGCRACDGAGVEPSLTQIKAKLFAEEHRTLNLDADGLPRRFEGFATAVQGRVLEAALGNRLVRGVVRQGSSTVSTHGHKLVESGWFRLQRALVPYSVSAPRPSDVQHPHPPWLSMLDSWGHDLSSLLQVRAREVGFELLIEEILGQMRPLAFDRAIVLEGCEPFSAVERRLLEGIPALDLQWRSNGCCAGRFGLPWQDDTVAFAIELGSAFIGGEWDRIDGTAFLVKTKPCQAHVSALLGRPAFDPWPLIAASLGSRTAKKAINSVLRRDRRL